MNLKWVFVAGLLVFLSSTTCFETISEEIASWKESWNFSGSSDQTKDADTVDELKENMGQDENEDVLNCPEHFELVGDQCYYISMEEKLDWSDANLKCESLGADLAQITNEKEMLALDKHLGKMRSRWFWIAGIDSDNDGKFEWKLNGEAVTYTKWRSGEPTTSYPTNCISLYGIDGEYEMSDFNCIGHLSFICKAKANRTKPKIKKICPEKFSLVGNKCYFVEEANPLDRFDAKISCLSMGAELTKIENSVEMKAVNEHLISLNSNSFWIAGTDLQSEGNYYWDTVDNKMTYTKWARGQPDHYDQYEHCVQLFSQSGGYYMNDINCYYNLAYICESKPKDASEAVGKLPTETIIKTLKPLLTDKSCPKDFSKVGNKCYFVQNAEKSNWYAADRNCQKVKADLVTIESSVEMELLAKHLQDLGKETTTWSWALELYWTAANDLGSEGKFHWQSNGESMSYAKWFPREPNNTGDKEHCANLKYYDDGYYMNDDTCEKEMYYICETKLLLPEAPNANLDLSVATCAELDLLKLNLVTQTKVMDMLYANEGCSKKLA